MFQAMPKMRRATAIAIVHVTAHSRPTTSSTATARLPSMASAASPRDERSDSRSALSPYRAASTAKKPAIIARRAAPAMNGALIRRIAITMLMSALIEALRRALAVDRRTPCSTSKAAANASRKPERGPGASVAAKGVRSASSPSTNVTAVMPTTAGP